MVKTSRRRARKSARRQAKHPTTAHAPSADEPAISHRASLSENADREDVESHLATDLLVAASRRSVRFFLTAEQQDDLEMHLSSVLDGKRLSRAVFTLDLVCLSVHAERTFAAEGKLAKARLHELFTKMLTHGRAMQDALQKGRTHIKYVPSLRGVNWAAFDRALDAIVEQSFHEAQRTRPRQRRGRPPMEWRDKLIGYAFHAYPPKTATKSVGSHFEQTVELLLGFLGNDVQDIHGVVVDALRRDALRLRSRQSPPFLARVKPP